MRAITTTSFTRRQVLAASATLALLVSGCTTGAPQAPTPPPPDPLEELLQAHVDLAAAYQAHAAAPTGLADNVDTQIAALAGALALRADEVPAADPTNPQQPDTDALRERELALEQACADLALSAPAPRAPLLASLAAAHRGAAKVLA